MAKLLVGNKSNQLISEVKAFEQEKQEAKQFATLVNLDNIIKEWAKRRYFKLADKKQKKIDEEYLQVNIDWSTAQFIHNAPMFKHGKHVTVPKSQVLFESHFDNDTGVEQEYSLRADRSTRSSCEIEYETGFSVGCEAGLTLQLPNEILSANTGFHKEINLTKKDCQVVEEEMTWSVDNKITVPEDSAVTATVYLTEENVSADFEIETLFKGFIEVTFEDRRTKELIGTFSMCDLVEDIFSNIKKPGFSICNVGDEEAVRVVTKGKCKFSFGVKQHVNVIRHERATAPVY